MLRIGTFFTAHRISLLGLLFSLAVGLIAAGQAQAATGQLRIGTLAPKNSLYHRQLMEVGEAWRSAQGEGAKYLVYPDGSKMKFFAWAGESEQQDIMKSLGYTPVPLETSDILPSIQTGMITAVPATPYFALASQVYATAGHMLDINWAPIVGALVVTKKSWDEMSPAARDALKAAGTRAGLQMRTQARKEVDEAVDAMKKRGLQVHTPPPEQLKEWNALAEQLYPRIRGRMVPAETFDEVMKLLKDYRAGKR